MTVTADAVHAIGGLAAGLVAIGLFVAFAAYVVVQRVRHGRVPDDASSGGSDANA